MEGEGLLRTNTFVIWVLILTNGVCRITDYLYDGLRMMYGHVLKEFEDENGVPTPQNLHGMFPNFRKLTHSVRPVVLWYLAVPASTLSIPHRFRVAGAKRSIIRVVRGSAQYLVPLRPAPS